MVPDVETVSVSTSLPVYLSVYLYAYVSIRIDICFLYLCLHVLKLRTLGFHKAPSNVIIVWRFAILDVAGFRVFQPTHSVDSGEESAGAAPV